MSAHCCVDGTMPEGRAAEGGSRPASWLRRGGKAAEWLVPGAVLAALPKCPMCLAAYIALGTGIGISVPAAAHLREAAIVVSIGSLGFLIARRANEVMRRLGRA